MIVLDSHIWFWWTLRHPKLSNDYIQIIQKNESTGLIISAISCWELALAHKKGKLLIPCSLDDWFKSALSYPGIVVQPLTTEIGRESVGLPEPFHRDPADRFIVATARVLKCPILTADEEILSYPHVKHP